MTEVPPSRYKVVERGRRLVVIDNLTDRAVPSKPERQPGVPPRHRAKKHIPGERHLSINERGDRVVRTLPFYDDKAPRRIIISGEAAGRMTDKARTVMVPALIGWMIVGMVFPPLWFAPLALFLQPVRRAMRRTVTGWLDRLDQASTASSDG